MSKETGLNTISEEQLQKYIDDNFKSIANSFYDGLITYESEGYDKAEINKMKDPFAKYLRLSLFDNLKFQENIIANSNLRPQRIRFKLANGEYANIYDINASEDLYLLDTKYYKYRKPGNLSYESLRQEIQESAKALEGKRNVNIVSVYCGKYNIDRLSVDI